MNERLLKVLLMELLGHRGLGTAEIGTPQNPTEALP